MAETTEQINECEGMEAQYDRFIAGYTEALRELDVAFPDDVRDLKARVPALEGFLGGSSAERLPVEGPIRQAVAEFKSIKS